MLSTATVSKQDVEPIFFDKEISKFLNFEEFLQGDEIWVSYYPKSRGNGGTSDEGWSKIFRGQRNDTIRSKTIKTHVLVFS